MTLRDRYVVEQEPEEVASNRVLLVVVIGVVIAAATVGLAWLLLPSKPPLGARPDGLEPEREEVGEVFVTGVRRSAIGLEEREEGLQHLQHYGWIDRDAGIAHVPIETAMELYLERQGAEAAP